MTDISINNFNRKKVKWIQGFKGLYTPHYPIKVPGVTAVINDLIDDPDLDKFIQDVGEEKAQQIMEAAAQRGTAMHMFIEHFIKKLYESKDPSMALQYTQQVSIPLLEKEGVPMEKIDKGREMFYNFYYSEYANAYIDLLGSELSFYSPSYYYRGLIDVFYKEQAFGPTVTDFKTSSKPIKKGSIKELKYKRQLGAYAFGVEDLFKVQKNKEIKINKASIVVMQTKSSIIQEITCQGSELEEQKEEFKKLVKQWHINNGTDYLLK